MLEFKQFDFQYKVLEKPRSVEGYAAVYNNIDAGNGFWRDIIHPNAFAKSIANPQQRRRVRYLWDHNSAIPPLGPITQLSEDSKGLFFVGRLTEGVALADTIYALLKDNAIDELSIGYRPQVYDFEDDTQSKSTIRHLRELELFDISHVVWGMNDQARVEHVKAFQTLECKGAIPFRSYPLADKGLSWDAGAQVKDATDAENPDLKGSYKLPHHLLDGYKTVWRGVAAAMARLMQANTQIPDRDRRGVYEHLAKHYREFDEEPPDFKVYQTELEAQIACRAEVSSEIDLTWLEQKMVTLPVDKMWTLTRTLLEQLTAQGYDVAALAANAEPLKLKAQADNPTLTATSSQLTQQLYLMQGLLARDQLNTLLRGGN